MRAARLVRLGMMALPMVVAVAARADDVETRFLLHAGGMTVALGFDTNDSLFTSARSAALAAEAAAAAVDHRDAPVARRPTRPERGAAIVVRPDDPNVLVAGLEGAVAVDGQMPCAVVLSRNGGRGWSAPRMLAGVTAAAYACGGLDLAYTADGSRLLVAYGADGDVLVRMSDDDGTTWSTPVTVFDGGSLGDGGYGAPVFAVPPTGAEVVFAPWRAGSAVAPEEGVALARGNGAGTAWSAPAAVLRVASGAGEIAGWDAAAGASGQVLLAYALTGATVPSLNLAHSADGGLSFTAVTIAAEAAARPSIAIDTSGGAHIAYTRLAANADEPNALRYTASAGAPYEAWSAPATVAAVGQATSGPALAVGQCGAGETLHMVWEMTRPSSAEAPGPFADVVYGRKPLAPAGDWSPAIRVSDRPSLGFAETLDTFRMAPRLSAMAEDAMALWTDRRDTTRLDNPDTDVFASRIDLPADCR